MENTFRKLLMIPSVSALAFCGYILIVSFINEHARPPAVRYPDFPAKAFHLTSEKDNPADVERAQRMILLGQSVVEKIKEREESASTRKFKGVFYAKIKSLDTSDISFVFAPDGHIMWITYPPPSERTVTYNFQFNPVNVTERLNNRTIFTVSLTSEGQILYLENRD